MIIFKRLFQFLSVQLDYKDIGYSDFPENNLTIASTETTTDLLFISINQITAYSLESALCLCLKGNPLTVQHKQDSKEKRESMCTAISKQSGHPLAEEMH